MAQTKLVKILSEGDINVQKLSETNISEYIQAKETLKMLKTYVVDPFENHAKQQKVGSLFSSDLGSITLKQQQKNQKYTAKELCTLTDSMLRMYVNQNSSDKRLDGVKRYDGEITVDANHLNTLIHEWSSTILGNTTEIGLQSKISDLEKLMEVHTPRLFRIDSPRIINNFDESTVGLYLSSKEQVKSLQKTVLTPFENAFKVKVEENENETFLDVVHYGNLSVAVKCVPRKEANYLRVIENTQSFLHNVATMTASHADGSNFFFNDGRLQPTMYVNANHLLSVIDFQKNHKDTKFKKEVSVLYKPQVAHIMMG